MLFFLTRNVYRSGLKPRACVWTLRRTRAERRPLRVVSYTIPCGRSYNKARLILFAGLGEVMEMQGHSWETESRLTNNF